jgi:parvulin-like peptidyl-prolyl isomerase
LKGEIQRSLEGLAGSGVGELLGSGETVAVVNGHAIRESELRLSMRPGEEVLRRDYFTNQPAEYHRRVEQLQADTIESLITRELIVSAFEAAGNRLPPRVLDDDLDQMIRNRYQGFTNTFLKVLELEGDNLEAFRRRRGHELIAQAMRQHALADLPPPSDDAVEDYYHAHETNYWRKEAVDLSMIVINKDAKPATSGAPALAQVAAEVHARLKSGADFAEQARQYNRGSRATNGGSWGCVERGILRPELEDVAFSLATNQVSDLVKTADAFYIMRVTGRRTGALIPLSEVKGEVRQRVSQQQRTEAIEQWLVALRRNAKIQTFPGPGL